MTTYKSNDELFSDLDIVIEHCNKYLPNVGSQLREGMQCVNGLTDGWALLYEYIDKVLIQDSKNLHEKDLEKLQKINTAIKVIVPMIK